MQYIGEKIAYLRRKLEYSRKYLAHNICDESTLYRIENSSQLPRLDVLKELCQKLNVSVDYILQPNFDFNHTYRIRFKKLCRESLYQNDFLTLKYLVDEMDRNLSKKVLQNDHDFRRFLDWQRAILFDKVENQKHKAAKLLQELIPRNKILNELDVNIANSLAILLIDEGKYEMAQNLLQQALYTLDKLAYPEDLSLYCRVSYNLAYLMYQTGEYERCIDLCFKIEYHLLNNQLIYSKGELYHLLGIVFHQTKEAEQAISYLEQAKLVFKLERKHSFAIRTMCYLAEIHAEVNQASHSKLNINEAIQTLNLLEDITLIEEMEKKIKHTQKQCTLEE